jgi:hypothetical protein
MKHPIETWKWFGMPAHFIGASYCRFHMATRVGPWMVSSVGYYQMPSSENPTEIGCGRLYETMVFRAAECACGGSACEGHMLESGEELDMIPANDAVSASANHMAACLRWADEE